MNNKTMPQGFHPVRRDRLLQEQTQDAYKLKGKLPEPTVCAQCGAVFREGRWQWGEAPKEAHHATCPACHRANDHYPAGFVSLGGAFFVSHREEIMKLVRHEAEREKLEHPLKRIMAIEEQNDAVLITTTDIHLARGIGEAVHHAYQGELEFHYKPDENLLRVHWAR
ncbi:MAG: BCAM0308 family protein [Sulfuritalea sp.]|jgi:NMD protein affecting ribosome stability and mRNA decay|nr:BCAM0308 family protein [Sulfuritalea sp.]